MHLLPLYPQFEEAPAQLQTQAKSLTGSSLTVKASVATKDSTSESFWEITFGTSCAFLLAVIIVLLIIIWMQRGKILRLAAFFHGDRRPNQEELRPIIYNRADNVDRGQNLNNDEINVVQNPIILHQNQNINNVVDAIFPVVLPGFRNITALRNFQKNQRDVFKAYQHEQIRIFQPQRQN